MKALTISEPYASLIAIKREKFVENRNWEMLHRGPLAIHAGKGTQYLDRSELAKYPAGCILGTAVVIACVHVNTIRRRGIDCDDRRVHHAYSLTWRQLAQHRHVEGKFCIVLATVRTLKQPIPCKGAQGLWNVPESIAAALVDPNNYRAA